MLCVQDEQKMLEPYSNSKEPKLSDQLNEQMMFINIVLYNGAVTFSRNITLTLVVVINVELKKI